MRLKLSLTQKRTVKVRVKQVAIGAVRTLYESVRRRLQEGEEAVGVEVEYLATLSDARDVNTLAAAFASGSFSSVFATAIASNFGEVSVEPVTSAALSDEGVGDGEAFLGADSSSLSDKLLSPYIVLGIVCSSVGVVWLLFLRSNIDSKPPSYLTEAMLQPAAVQMVHQTSD